MPYAASIFNAHAATYDTARRRIIPPFEQFYGTAIEAIGLAGDPPDSTAATHILDLGAGTGMLSAFALEAYPEAWLTLFDGAAMMLEKARESLGSQQTAFIEGDLYAELPDGPWDAVISALAIHHLDDPGKRHVFDETIRILRPGGVFVNAEHILGPTPALDSEYRRWHEAAARGAGVDDDEWAAAEHRMTADHLAPLADQLEWLTEAGFEDVDCLFKDRGFAVIFARKPAG
jgi:tRNA (cmo5U34)-methyltransferase